MSIGILGCPSLSTSTALQFLSGGVLPSLMFDGLGKEREAVEGVEHLLDHLCWLAWKHSEREEGVALQPIPHLEAALLADPEGDCRQS